MPSTAKLFKNGRSQAVRLPSEFRFEGSEVDIRKDSATGNVILSPKPRTLEHLFQLLEELGPAPEEFLADRDQTPPTNRVKF